MRVLLTGAFGNIGTSTMDELMRRGHQVRCFDLKTRANQKAARRLGERAEIVWGDLRRPEQVIVAVQGQDVVLHVAFVIPHLSVTGIQSEDHPDWARAINVGGTRNLLEAMKAQPRPPRIIFTSSMHVYGSTQERKPPRTTADPIAPVEHYARHKAECEEMIKASGLEWAIFRLAAALPVRLLLDPAMFNVPLANRIEYVHARDVGVALANAVDCADVWGRTLLIGGGPQCQVYYREMVSQVLNATGVGMLPQQAFTDTPYAVDWLDTANSQHMLAYQQRTLHDYVQDMRRKLGWRLPWIKAFRPVVRYWLLKQSPRLRSIKWEWTAVAMKWVFARP